MNTPIEYQLKHRLTGAVIIVLMGVILIPLILREPTVPPDPQIPLASVDSSEQETLTRLTDIVKGNVQEAETESQEQLTGAAKPISATSIPNSEIVESSNDPETSQKPTIVMTQNPEQPGDSSSDSLVIQAASDQMRKSELDNVGTDVALTPGWTVRVGTFAEQRYAKLAIEKLDEHNLVPKRTRVTTSAGQAVRVWLGPYPTEEEAKRVAISLKDITGQEGYVPRP